MLEEEDDINQITDYFSYEHFYVIYCKFWELDTDHDLYIDPKDLARYNDHGETIHTGRQADRQTDRQAGRRPNQVPADRQTNREADRDRWPT